MTQGTPTTYASSLLNQYTATANPAQSFIHDEDGNLIGNGAGWTYTWDGENRLAKAVNGASGMEVDFVYDYMGRRMRKTVKESGSVTSDRLYLYDGWNLTAEYGASDTSSPIRTWTWGLDMSNSLQGTGGVGGLLSCHERTGANSGVYCFTYDGNGNVSEVLDDSGAIAAHYEYGPFGELLVSTGALADLNPFGFSTNYTERESGLVYGKRRWYDPSTGRWLSRDPIGERGGPLLYGFVGNNPINRVDPFGLFDVDVNTEIKRASNVRGGVADARGVKLVTACLRNALTRSTYFLLTGIRGTIEIRINSDNGYLDDFWGRGMDGGGPGGYQGVLQHEQVHERSFRKFFDQFVVSEIEKPGWEKVCFSDKKSCEDVAKKLEDEYTRQFNEVEKREHSHLGPHWKERGY